MNDLVRTIALKPERMESIKKGLVNDAYDGRPDFRNLSRRVKYWQDMGYTQDPSKLYLPDYTNMNFHNIVKFYKENVQNTPLSMAIVGTKKNVPIDELKKLGKVVIVHEKDISVD